MTENNIENVENVVNDVEYIENKEVVIATPISAMERVKVIDILRGVAILGILLVNMHFFSHSMMGSFLGFEAQPVGLDKFAHNFVRFFAESKFYSLFSFLFGLGMAVIFERSEKKGVKFGPLYGKRIFFLMIFGIIHGIFIWSGDILLAYSIFGFIVIAFDKAKPKTLVIWFFVLILIPILLLGTITGFMELGKKSEKGREAINLSKIENEKGSRGIHESAIKAYGSGTYIDMVKQRVDEVKSTLSGIFFYGWNVLAMFLIGAYAWRKNYFKDIEGNLKFFKKVFIVCAILGIIFNTLYVYTKDMANPSWPSPIMFLNTIFIQIGAPTMCFAYISGIVLLSRKEFWAKLLNPISAIGRTALSNYIFQSLLLTFIFYNHGLGLFGKTNYLTELIFTFVLFAFQIVLSNLWLKKFRFGPLEWLWRSLTYGKMQPMKVN